MKRYLTVWIVVTVALLAAVALLNIVVDPYGLYRIVDAPGFNAIKPKSGPHGSMVKAYQVVRVAPRALILGNSRAEVGFDPERFARLVDRRPAFNLALPGTGPSTTLAVLQHAIAVDTAGRGPKIEAVVWGVDFPDFLTDPKTPGSTAYAAPDRRLLVGPDGAANPARAWQHARDLGEATLTLGALFDSAQTLASQRNAYAADLTPLGFNPMRDYVKIAADEGYWGTFRQKDLDNTRAYLRRPTAIFDASGRTSPDLTDLRRALDVCRRHHVALTLVIYPIHAHLLEIIRLTDHWTAFEAWKRAVVAIVAEEARASGGAPFPLWDFSGFHRYATEPVPKPGDRRTAMQWYWEAGHFKRELGDKVLDRALGAAGADHEFGVLLDPSNVEQQIATTRDQERAYRAGVPDEVAALEKLAIELRPRR